MATQTLVQPRWWKNLSGANGPLMLGNAKVTVVGEGEEPWIREAASQTYDAGDLVYEDTSGNIAICTNSSSKLDSEILGIAARDASGTTSAPAYVTGIRPSDVILMNVFHSTAASSVTNQNQLRDIFGIILNSGKWHVDIENTTTEDATTALAKVRVVGFPVGIQINGVASALGDTNGFVLVQFLPFTIATDGSPFTRNLQLQG